MNLSNYYTEHYEELKNLAFSLCGGREYYEDLLQDVFIKIMDKDIEGNVKGYIYRVMCNYLRERGFMADYIKWERTRTDIKATDFAEDIESKMNIERVDLILSRMDRYDRLLFYAYTDPEVNFRDIAKDVGVSYRTLYRDAEKVRNIIKEQINE